MLMNDNGDVKIGLVNSFRFLLVGAALNLIMPAGAGDVAKSYFGYKWTGIKERMFSVSLFDKIIAIASIGILGLYSLFMTKEYYYIGAVIISFFPFLLIMIHNKSNIELLKRTLVFIDNRVKKLDLKEIMLHFNFSRRTIFYSFMLSLAAWLATYFLMFLCFQMIGVPIEFHHILIVSPLITLGRLFPFTFNGIGSDEAIILYLFSSYYQNDTLILTGAILYRLILLIIPAVIGAYFLFTIKGLKLVNENAKNNK